MRALDCYKPNTLKYICNSCGVEWVENEAADDADDITIKHVADCASCCPQNYEMDNEEPDCGFNPLTD